ncbi:unnamed protein product [Gulo gulo]|uniref:Uncharacterized protein n=1 Tax=Gulo gulo TaxID=48420 RepID=A0A9X9LJ26_GULGU|nr:unnamed protein product [Gulo gulo]
MGRQYLQKTKKNCQTVLSRTRQIKTFSDHTIPVIFRNRGFIFETLSLKEVTSEQRSAMQKE